MITKGRSTRCLFNGDATIQLKEKREMGEQPKNELDDYDELELSMKQKTYDRVMNYQGKEGITNEHNFDKILNELLDTLDAELGAR